MASVVLAASNQASLTFSVWSGWTGTPHDLLLVAEDGMIEAHCGLLFPMSRHLANLFETLPYTGGLTQVVLAGTKTKVVAAVKDLIYTGTCYLDEIILPEIFETLAAFGIEVSSNSFIFQTKSTDDGKTVSNHSSSQFQDSGLAVASSANSDVYESVKEDLEGAEADDAMKTKEETEAGVETFEGINVGEAFHNVESSLSTSCKDNRENTGKVVQVKISKLKMGEKLSLHTKERIFACDVIDCKIKFKSERNLKRHIQSVHIKEKPHQCDQCMKKFSQKVHLKKHTNAVHNKEKPHQCNQCLEKFSQKNTLKMHIIYVHETEKPLACPQPGCTEMFKLKRILKRHMIKVHNFEKPHACAEENCDEKFLHLSYLKDHLRRAHGAAKLVCGFQNCSAAFTTHHLLKKHKNEHHSAK